MRALLIPLALSLLAGPAIAQREPTDKDKAKLEKLLAGRTPGQPISCIPGTTRNLRSEQVGPNTLVYYQNNQNDRTIWRNDPPGGCVTSNRDVAFITRRPSTQTCRGDILQAFDPLTRMPYGSCALGDFIPYTKAK